MIKKLIALWFVLSLSLIAVTEWIAYRNMVMLVETGQVMSHTLEILSNIKDLESQILEAESARRGFVITGKALHLSRFKGATQKMEDLMVQLHSLTRDDSLEQSRLDHLTLLINQKIDNLNQSIRLRRQKGFNLGEQIAMTDAGKVIQDDIQQVLDDLAKTEKQQLWQRYVQRTTKAQRSLLELGLGTLLSFGLFSLVFWSLNREVSGRMKAETSLRRANRTLKTLIEGSQAMVRAVDEGGLLQEICRILVDHGGYRLAWVGLAVPDQEKTVRPLAHYGLDDGYLETLALTYADVERGQGPFGVSIRTGQAAISRNIQEDQSFTPWRAEALKRGFASACVFPLKIDGRPWGGLAIYADEPDVFDAAEVKLLAELARDLEYGLEVLRDRVEHQRAEKALEESEAQYRLLVNNLNHGLVIADPQGSFTFVNPKFGEMLGYSRDELMGRQVFDFFDPTNQEIIRDQLNRRRRGEREPYEIAFTRKDGEKIIVLITPIPIFDAAGNLQKALAVITDITDRKQAEARTYEHLQSLNLLIAGVEKLAKLRDPDVMAQEICQLVVDAFDSRLVWLGVVENQGRLRPLNWAGETADCLKDLEMCMDAPVLDQGPAGQAVDTGKPWFINELGMEGRETPWVAAALARGYQALAAFPLMRGHQAFACLNIYSDRPNFFTPERVDLLQAFAGIAAAAVENAHLNAKVEKHLKQLQALRQIDLAISGSLDLHTTLNVLLDQLTSQLGVDAATVMLLNSRTLALECAAERGFRSDALSRAQVPLGQGCAGVVALERKPLYISDLAAVQDKRVRNQLVFSEGFVSYYGAPLLNRGQIRGVIEICHRSRFDADEDRLGFLESLAGQAAIAIDNATLFDEMERSHLELTLAYEATLEGWALALELRDFETKGHSQRVTDLTVKLARALGVEGKDLTQIYRGALLHDIGKIAVPDKILLKPGPLTPEEWVIMRQHPIYAYELLSPIAYLGPALDIPFCHHERWDGGGYPRGLKGEDIPLAARIFAVVDVWDALGNDRPYRPAWPQDRIRAYLQEQAGTQFDPEVVEVFLEKILDQADTAA
jgi:PAS domain S-box-containing protein